MALSLAVPKETIELLPVEISDEMEKWESDFVNISSIYHCFDSELSSGWLQKTASFSDGRKFRAWTYGKRNRLQTTHGIAVWGISLGQDFAISENAYRVESLEGESGKIWFAGGDVAYGNAVEKQFTTNQLQPTVRRVGGIQSLHYPIILASGSKVEDIITKKYQLSDKRLSFTDALNDALEKNGSLLRIDDENENKLITKYLLKEFEEERLFEGLDEFNETQTYIWIGATDAEDQNGTRYDEENNKTVNGVSINAFEGDGWRWINGKDENISYHNWKWGSVPPHNSTKDYAAMDWNETNGSWVDINETARLPFIIEKNFDLPTQKSDLSGVRKVLVVPARFVDETNTYKSAMGGSNNPLTNELGEGILEELQTDSYEPISRAKIDQAMEEVREFFYRNTDGSLDLVSVVSSTVTLPIFRYKVDFDLSESSLYDSEGNLSGLHMIKDGEEAQTLSGATEVRTVLGEDYLETPFAINFQALGKSSELSDEWNIGGNAFVGVEKISIDNPLGFLSNNLTEPPKVEIIGGENRLNGAPHPRFRPANVEAIIDDEGNIREFVVIDPGAFYDFGEEPEIIVNGTDYTNLVSINIENLLVSYVILSNYSGGALGLGFVGGPGAHVQLENGDVDSSTIAHEIGHNFGLLHANRYFTKSERVLSDDADQVEYGNPYTVMGTGDITEGGDLTLAGKVTLKNRMSTGYTMGSTLGVVDVVDLNETTLTSASVEELKENNTETNNTFRIYRSNFGTPPLGLKQEVFKVDLPADLIELLNNLNNNTFNLNILGSGQDANGTLDYNTTQNHWELNITHPGRGYVEEPMLEVLDENNSQLFVLSPSWVREQLGTNHTQKAEILDEEFRWLRGIRAQSPSDASVRPFSMLTGEDLIDYFLSYRTDISTNGVTVNIAIRGDEILETFLLDMTPQTPQEFENDDGVLLLGKTYSDYEADLHFLPQFEQEARTRYRLLK